MSRPTCFVQTCDRLTPAGLCHDHRRELINHLDELPQLVDDLNTQLTKQSRYSTASAGDGEGIVIWNEGAARTLQRITKTMRKWDRLVHDHLAIPVRHPNPLRAARAIRDSVKAGRLDTWPTITRLIDDLTTIAAQTAKTIDRPAVEHFLGICTAQIDILIRITCDTKLYATEDTDTVRCPTCGTTHLVDTNLELLLAVSDDTLVTATQAAHAMSTKDDADNHRNRLVDRIRQWQNRSRLLPRGTIIDAGHERKLYRLGDIKALVTDYDRQTSRK